MSVRLISKCRGRSAFSLFLSGVLLVIGAARVCGATLLVDEGFEGAFPSGWTVGDDDPTGRPSFWGKVDAAFGGEGTHSGSFKGYAAGSNPEGTSAAPLYPLNLRSFMQRTVDLSPFNAASLSFYYTLPSLELCCDFCRVLMDGTAVWTNGPLATAWTPVTLDLGAYVGGTHTLRFEFVSDVSLNAEGWYVDDISATGYLRPPNDPFGSAQTIVGQSGALVGVNTDATKEAGEPAHAGNAGGASVWYRWLATSSGTVVFHTAGSSLDTLLAVYTGGSVGALTPVAANDDVVSGDVSSSVAFAAVLGTTYYIAIDGFGGQTGGFSLTWLFPTVTETVLAATNENYVPYVLDSDANNDNPGYDRDTIRIRTTVRSVNGSPAAHVTTYVLQCRLLDASGQAHPIYDLSGSVNAEWTFNSTQSFLIGSLATVDRDVVLALRPAAPLSPYQFYHAEVKVLRLGTPTGTQLASEAKGYYHFPNLVSPDPALNVIAVMSLASWQRTSAIRTVAGREAFTVDASFALIRYDDFGAPTYSVANVPVTLTYELREAGTGEVLPLKANVLATTAAIESFQPGSNPRAPQIAFFTRTLSVEPAAGVQLDSVGKAYEVRVTVAHTDLPGQPAVVGNRQVTVAQRLMHFNGHLFFGAIDTLFTSVAADPGFLSVVPDVVRATLAINNGSGFVVGKPAYTYGDGTTLTVGLRANGNAELLSGSVPVTYTPGGFDLDVAGCIRFVRGSVTLSPSGAAADLAVVLPAGLGWTTDLTQRYLYASGSFPAVPLNASLRPAIDPVLNAPLWICEETKPVWIEVNATTWEVANSRFVMVPTGAIEYVRRQPLQDLEASPAPADQKIKRSNEQYFRSILHVTSPRVTVATDDRCSARLTVDMTFASGEFRAHFPYDAFLRWVSGVMNVRDDAVDVAASRLDGVDPVRVPYQPDCTSLECVGSGGGGIPHVFVPDGGLSFTKDGGLAAGGQLQVPFPVAWGFIPSLLRFAHATENLQPSRFLMSGIFLRGGDAPGTPALVDHAGALLLTGYRTNDLTLAERPGDAPAYEDGFAGGFGDYAGLNFRMGDGGPFTATSTIAGSNFGPYTLTSRSKYYLRWGGVSGIHEAVPNSFPASNTLYGYGVNFKNFGFSYLDNQNIESRTRGYVAVPKPSHFTNNFEELKLSCLGALSEAKVPTNEAGVYKLLEYWNGDFVTQTIRFDRKAADQCDPGKGWLVLGVKAHATYVDQALYGDLGFLPNGNLITFADDVLDDFGSRLKAPASFKLKGPAQETYVFTPVADAYFNNHDFLSAPGDQGFMNLLAKIDVPFFEDLRVHVHTWGKTNHPSAPIYLMGGWPNEGMEDTGGNHFFNAKVFDLRNAGYPAAGVTGPALKNPVSLALYHNNPDGTRYHPRAQRTWLEVIDFDYPLQWDGPSRSFRSFGSVKKQALLVLETDNKVKYLSAKNAELVFGVQYDDLPTLSIANLGFNALEDKFGVIEAFTAANLKPIHDALTDGFQRLDRMLNPDARAFFQGALDHRVQPGISNLYNALLGIQQAKPTAWKADVKTKIHEYFTTPGNTALFRSRFANLAGAEPDLAPTLQLFGLLSELDSDLAKVDSAISSLDSLLGDVSNAKALIKALVNQLAAKYAGGIVDGKTQEILDQSAASVNEIRFTLKELRKTLADLRNRLKSTGPGDLAAELKGKLSSPAAGVDIQAFLVQAETDVSGYFDKFKEGLDNPFLPSKRAALEGFIRQKLEDRFLGSPVAASLQVALKQRFYDFDAAYREAADSVFQQLNVAIREQINQYLAALDNSLSDFLGDLKVGLAGGKINGYAHIKGDSLNELRLDLQAQWRVPSPMEFGGFIRIRELNSETMNNACSDPGDDFTEVTLGASASVVKWLSAGLDATVTGKFAFRNDATHSPAGMGGSIQLNGPLQFEFLSVEELAASVGFGIKENFLSGAARVRFNSYEGAGGLFFGRTCTLDPIELWDDGAAKALGNVNPGSTFTGAYGYAEVWIPISEALLGIPASCMFEISASTGAGAFYFEEGPTYGGTMSMGASGEILCLVSVKGTIKATGAKGPNGLSMHGDGTLKGKLGSCPFCKKFKKKVSVDYNNGSWNVSY